MIEPTQVYQKILSAHEEAADALDKAERADRERKAIFSALVIANLESAGSVAKAEHMARCSDKYMEACHTCEELEHKANIARAKRSAADVWWEAVRTAESTKRAEMKL